MATLDLSKAKKSFSLDDPNLVGFASVDGTPTSTAWSYLTPAGHRVLVKGANMQFDRGLPTAGTVTSIEIDVGNDGSPDLVITGISVGAFPLGIAVLENSPASFWRWMLDGNDVILGPERAQGAPTTTFILAGDGTAARPGDTSGGRDIVHIGDGFVHAYGDVKEVGNPTAGTPTAYYRGGNDDILGLVAALQQSISGDVSNVYAGSTLDGGNDTILIQSRVPSYAIGDANNVLANATVVGGNDYITAGKDFQGYLVGDAFGQRTQSLVHGGNDTINGGDLSDNIAGDVYQMQGGQLVGGDDTINGGGGNDIIAGDAYDVRSGSIVTGGDDLIRAGGGNDEVYGHAGYGATGSNGVGGNDRLYGDSGNDRLHGEGGADTIDGGTQSDVLYGGDGGDWLSGGADNDTLYGDAGNDMLDGGTGADLMAGLTGNDTYFVNDPGDIVYELAGFGTDTVWTTLATTTLAANVEKLSFNGVGSFTGVGNDLNNVITGSAGADTLNGGDGNDVLIGGAGADALIGGNGIDTASYVTASGGVDARLTGSSPDFGGDARGDTYAGIENLAGSDFQDNLFGDDQANTLSGRAAVDNLIGLGGKDILRGGGEADYLWGGLGDDVFDFDRVDDSTPGARDICYAGYGALAIDGAGVAGGDLIDLSGIDANLGVAGNQAFVFGGAGAGRVSAASSGSGTVIRCNIDTDAAFEFELLIEDGTIAASAYRGIDFIL